MVYKEQKGARPVWAMAGSGIARLRRKVREKVKGEKTLVTKIPEMGRRAATSDEQLAISERPHGVVSDAQREEFFCTLRQRPARALLRLALRTSSGFRQLATPARRLNFGRVEWVFVIRCPSVDHPSKRNNGARWRPRMNRWAFFYRPAEWDLDP